MIDCIVKSPIHADGRRYEIGESVALDVDAYDRFRKHGCVVTKDEVDATAAAEAEAARFVEEARVQAESMRAKMLEESRAQNEVARAEAEAKAREGEPPQLSRGDHRRLRR